MINKISVVILTKNAEKKLENISSFLSGFNEKILIDDFSTDKTQALAKKLEFKFYTRSLCDDFSSQRNFGLSKTRNKYVLFLDQDEFLSNDLKNELLTMDLEELDGLRILRIEYLLGKKVRYGEYRNFRLVRFANKEKGIWHGSVHEVWKIDGKVIDSKGHIVHSSHSTISDYLRKINRYSSIRANELYDMEVRVGFFQIIIFSIFKFIHLYLLKFGFMDGIRGLISASIMAMYTFLVRSKLLLKSNE